MKEKDNKTEIAVPEEYTHFELTHDDIEATNWVWDRLHAPPGSPWMPLFNWWWFYGVNGAIAQACEDMPQPLSKGARSRSHRGYHFVSVCLPHSEDEIKERAARYKEAIRPWIEDTDQMMGKITSELMEIYGRFKKHDYENAGWGQLVEWMNDMLALRHKHWYWHYYSLIATGMVFWDWVDISKELLGIDNYHPQFQKLMKGFDNCIFEADRQQFKLAQLIINSGLKDMFLETRAEEIIPNFEKSEKGKEIAEELRNFLDKYGWRNEIMNSFDTKSLWEDPALVIERIKKYVADPVFTLDEVIAKQSREREKTEEEVLNKLNMDQREWYSRLMKAGQKCSVWMEEHSFYFEMYAHAINRYFWLQVGKKLARSGALENDEDIFFLVANDVFKLIANPYVLKAANLVKKRKAQWESAKQFVPEVSYGPLPLKEVMQKWIGTRDVVLVLTAFTAPPARSEDLGADLVGTVGSSGVAEGTARVVLSRSQLGEVQEGDILISSSIDSDWTPVFSYINGIVLDGGGPMSHAAIVAREYGIPSVLMTLTGTKKIKTGQRVRVDGDVGAVYVLEG